MTLAAREAQQPGLLGPHAAAAGRRAALTSSRVPRGPGVGSREEPVAAQVHAPRAEADALGPQAAPLQQRRPRPRAARCVRPRPPRGARAPRAPAGRASARSAQPTARAPRGTPSSARDLAVGGDPAARDRAARPRRRARRSLGAVLHAAAARCVAAAAPLRLRAGAAWATAPAWRWRGRGRRRDALGTRPAGVVLISAASVPGSPGVGRGGRRRGSASGAPPRIEPRAVRRVGTVGPAAGPRAPHVDRRRPCAGPPCRPRIRWPCAPAPRRFVISALTSSNGVTVRLRLAPRRCRMR